MHVLATVDRPATDLAAIRNQARDFIENSVAENTIRGYRSDWRGYTRWCDKWGLIALPSSPTTVAMYLSDMASNHKPATLKRHLACISKAHKTAHMETPTGSEEVKRALEGICRTLGVAQVKKAPVRVENLRAFVGETRKDAQGIRDKAMLLIGYAGAFRRSELVGLDVEDLEFMDEGLVIHVRKSKTDQRGEGMDKEIEYVPDLSVCPITALRAWLKLAEIAEGPIFRSVDKHGHIGRPRLTGRAVALTIKRLAPVFGLDPERVSGHSLRAGLVTDAYSLGVPEGNIMGVTGHRSLMVMRGYQREAKRFTAKVATQVFASQD